MTDPIELIRKFGVVPVITIDQGCDVVALADALLEGGLPIAEITFRTEAAADAIALMRDARPNLCVGAGTVLTRSNLERAIDAGAAFGLAPGFDASIVDAAQSLGFPFYPGIMTPSELSSVAARGIGLVKFFPADVAGGTRALSSISTPFAHLDISFVATGGVTEATIGDWLALKPVIAVGGTWIAQAEDIRAGRFDVISKKSAAAVRAEKEALDKRQSAMPS